MLNFWQKNQNNRLLTGQQAYSRLVESPIHSWIRDNRYIASAFQELFEKMEAEKRYSLLVELNTLFLPSTGSYSCVVSNREGPVVLVFPELMKYLRAARPDYGLAILAHEIGHILLNHHSRELNVLESQVEADRFVCELGWGYELELFLSAQAQSVETRVRISYITRYLIQKGKF